MAASPNHVLETEFDPRQRVLIYRNETELVDILEQSISDTEPSEPIAARGHERAVARFSPTRLAETILSLLLMERPPRPADAPRETAGRRDSGCPPS
jgi:spore maturation protein CgeB